MQTIKGLGIPHNLTEDQLRQQMMLVVQAPANGTPMKLATIREKKIKKNREIK
jgi:hypothetical protein